MKLLLYVGCLMPGWVIQWSYWIPWSALAVAVALSVACLGVELRRRSLRWLVLYAGLLALQPGWSLLSREELFEGVMHVRADCGYSGRALSVFLLAASLAVAMIVFRQPGVRRRTFVFGLVAAFTFMSIVGEWLPFTGLHIAVPHELYATLLSGFGGPPWFLAILIVVCASLYVVQRIRPRTAV